MSVRSRIDINTINSLVKSAEYASLQQQPISFTRDVLALVINPSLKDLITFPSDVIERAEKYLRGIPNIGAYSESQGILEVRKEVCNFLLERDGYSAEPDNLCLTNGASEGVRFCMNTIMRNPTHGSHKDGILVPIPQYPLYSALTTLVDGKLIPYYLEEKNGWSCDVTTLSHSLEKARNEGVISRALVIINPGNPTSQLLPEENMKDIIRWCVDENICLMADEVYQENIWKEGKNFTSFRKLAYEMGAINDDKALQLVSFHSTSKGFVGECGLRGGYFEMLGFPEDVKKQVYKLASLSLCSNTIGQIAVGLMVNPPKIGQQSYEQYKKERDNILSSLKRRSVLVSQLLNKLEGVQCNSVDGAMYAFPSITLPEKAIKAAQVKNIEPDLYYCMELLDNTGIVVVPGSGFGQVAGTYHFRTTILPPEDKMLEVVSRLEEFHKEFMNKYR